MLRWVAVTIWIKLLAVYASHVICVIWKELNRKKPFRIVHKPGESTCRTCRTKQAHILRIQTWNQELVSYDETVIETEALPKNDYGTLLRAKAPVGPSCNPWPQATTITHMQCRSTPSKLTLGRTHVLQLEAIPFHHSLPSRFFFISLFSCCFVSFGLSPLLASSATAGLEAAGADTLV
jgi:hypothetical protein